MRGELRGRAEIDLVVDPPPDLILEMEVSRSAIDKLALFAAMGIPEVWRTDGHQVTILLLDSGEYRPSIASAALPALTTDRVAQFLTARRELLSHEWFQAVSDWARERRPQG